MESKNANRMGVTPVNKLLFQMSLPMIISMLVQALYNVVDSMFVSWISENALAALSLAFPLQTIMIGVAVGTGVGVNALLSRSLGEKNYDRANKTAINGLFLALMSWVVFLIVGLFLVKPYMAWQTDNTEIYEAGVSYLTICCTCSFGLFGEVAFERILQSSGRPTYAMITQLTGAITNIVFDPILIFGLIGFPKMGVAGAAIATVAGQILGMIVASILNRRNTDIYLAFRGFRPDGAIIRRIYAVGVPSIIMQCVGSLMTFLFNQILLGFSTTATAVFGVYYKLQSFVFMPVFGLNNGMVPIIAFNYGAQHKKRIMDTYKLAMLTAVGIMTVGLLIFQFAGAPLLRIFNASDEMLAIGVTALSIISIHFPVAGFCIATGSMFQALGNGVMSLLVSIARQIVVLLPAAYLLSLTGVLANVWWSFPIAEVMSMCMTAFFLRKLYKKEIEPMPDEA